MNARPTLTWLVIVHEKVRTKRCSNVDLRRRRRAVRGTAQPADGCLLSSRRDRLPAGVLGKGWRPRKERAHGPSGTAGGTGGTGVQDRGTGPSPGRCWSAWSQRRRLAADGGPPSPWGPRGVLRARRGRMEPSVAYLQSNMCTSPKTPPLCTVFSTVSRPLPEKEAAPGPSHVDITLPGCPWRPPFGSVTP